MRISRKEGETSVLVDVHLIVVHDDVGYFDIRIDVSDMWYMKEMMNTYLVNTY